MGIFTGVVFDGLIGRFFGNSQNRHVVFYEFVNVCVYGFMGNRIIREIMPQIQPHDINRIKSFITPCPYLFRCEGYIPRQLASPVKQVLGLLIAKRKAAQNTVRNTNFID
jgi:hypothetical protein